MDNKQLSTLNYDNIKEIERHIATYKSFLQIPQATANDISFFAQYCQKTRLDPLSRQIYAIPRQGSMQILLSIDGYRIIAQRTGEYEGSETFWCGVDGVWTDVWLNNNPPSAAKVIVYRKNCKRGVSAVALFKEYANLKSNTWQKMPALMLAKCAESLALRKAFPSDLSGLYTTDEMNNIEETNIVETTVIDVPKENYDINKDVYNGCEYSPFSKYSHIRFDEMEKGLLMWHINESQMRNTHPEHFSVALKVLKEKKKENKEKKTESKPSVPNKKEDKKIENDKKEEILQGREYDQLELKDLKKLVLIETDQIILKVIYDLIEKKLSELEIKDLIEAREYYTNKKPNEKLLNIVIEVLNEKLSVCPVGISKGMKWSEMSTDKLNKYLSDYQNGVLTEYTSEYIGVIGAELLSRESFENNIEVPQEESKEKQTEKPKEVKCAVCGGDYNDLLEEQEEREKNPPHQVSNSFEEEDIPFN
ncbi:phage recombination protein Bet [Brachyspira hyodysenteriae]|uniref:phage recombination protein Bet n=1 Tax=Brachyspira hyodysenteriae TaxID=159 RepID=UPI001ADD9C86|nr:phage recombination protein Bet [Brachyspira hyodysenteriae]QTM11472.1 phage recombination protein Bet [Brachyspira hyodysenteriae]